MTPEILDWIIKGVIAIVTALITTFLVPALVKWKNNLQQSNLQKFISETVRAAEQIYGPGTAELKKEYVINAIKEKYGNKLDIESLDNSIEAAVYEISQAIKNEQTKYTQAAIEAAEKELEANKESLIESTSEDVTQEITQETTNQTSQSINTKDSGSTGVKLG